MAVVASKGVKVDSTGLLRHLEDYANVMGKAFGEVCKDQAGKFCKDMIDYTRPFQSPSGGDGSSQGAKKAGESNVVKSVFKIIQPLDKATPREIANIGSPEVFKLWEKAVSDAGARGRKRRWKQFEAQFRDGRPAIEVIGKGDKSRIGALHTSLRRDNGHGGLMGFAARSKRPFAFAVSEADINSYAKQKQRDVGMLKSAYWFASVAIGVKINAPAWAKHTEAAGNAIAEDKSQRPQKPEVVVGNLIGNKMGNERFTQLAMNRRAYAMRNQVARFLNKNKVSLWEAARAGKVTGTVSHFSVD